MRRGSLRTRSLAAYGCLVAALALGVGPKVPVATLSPDQYPPEGQKFFKEFTQKYGEKNPDPYAIYGYEAMNLALDAIQTAGSGDQAAILNAIFDTKDRKS